MKEQGPILIIKHAETRADTDAAILSGLHPAPVETIETPTRTYRLTDLEGQPPPMVPTPAAVHAWGVFWWRASGAEQWQDDRGENRPEIVNVCSMALTVDGPVRYERHGEELDWMAEDDGTWLGPVTERPKETP